MAGSFGLRGGGLTLAVGIAILAFAVAYRLQQPLEQSSATYCYKGIRTHDEHQPQAQCFSVVNGTFTKVWSPDADAGSNSDVESTSTSTTAIDGYVIPGVWDGHGHLLQYGEFLHSVDLFGSESLDEVRKRMRTYLDSHPGAGTKDNWVRGVGWDQTFFGRMPTAEDVEQDDDLKGIYMMLDRIDVHCTWVSRAVLDLLPNDIPNVVPGGEIIREPGMGVFCDNAMDLVTSLWPKPGPEQQAREVTAAIKSLNSVGLVGMHDAGATPETLKLFAGLAESDEWTLRVYAMLECEIRNTYCPNDAFGPHRHEDKFMVQSVKLFADGALGSWGSAMLEPYTDHPWTSGSLLINASSLTQVAKQWAADGYQVNIHAIGDLANRNAIDALESALSQECPPQEGIKGNEEQRRTDLAACQSRRRFRIEHAQIVHPSDQERIISLGIIPSIQPTHATSDMKYAQDRLGPARLRSSAYRMRSLLPAAPILGSDFPVEPPNPFQGIYAAATRRSPHTGHGTDDSPDGWLPEEMLSLDDALWGFTGAPARGAFLDGRAGVIRKGALADWLVLDAPIDGSFDIESLRDLKVRETWVGGQRVYARTTDNQIKRKKKKETSISKNKISTVCSSI